MWMNIKFGKQLFKGSYERDIRGERVFLLVGQKSGRIVTFESYQLAQKAGWLQIKKPAKTDS